MTVAAAANTRHTFAAIAKAPNDRARKSSRMCIPHRSKSVRRLSRLAVSHAKRKRLKSSTSPLGPLMPGPSSPRAPVRGLAVLDVATPRLPRPAALRRLRRRSRRRWTKATPLWFAPRRRSAFDDGANRPTQNRRDRKETDDDRKQSGAPTTRAETVRRVARAVNTRAQHTSHISSRS